MPAIKKKKTEINVNSAQGNSKRMKKYKKSLNSRVTVSTTPSKFVNQVITRSKSKLLNQLKDKHLKRDLLNKKNEFSSRAEVSLIVIDDDEMEVNEDNKESNVLPSTSNQQLFSSHNSSHISDAAKETNAVITKAHDSSHSEKFESQENVSSTEEAGSESNVAEVFSKTNNIQAESDFNENNPLETIHLTQQQEIDQFSLNDLENRTDEMNTVTLEHAVDKEDIVGLLNQEIWKKKQLYHLQEGIVRMENQRLDTLKRIFKKWYENLFFKNKAAT